MDRISINLLPPQLKENKLFERKKKLINRLCVGFLSLLVVTSTVLIIFSVMQNNDLNSENEKLALVENNLNSLNEKEATVIILKKRLADITKIQNKKYPQTESFILISSLLPEETSMQSFSVDVGNKITLNGIAENAAAMQKFFDNLTDPAVNEGKIVKTNITNLNRGFSPRLIFELEISTNTTAGVTK